MADHMLANHISISFGLPVSDGAIIWIDEEVIGFKCACGAELTVGIYSDNPTECNCGRGYWFEQRVTVFEYKAVGEEDTHD